MSKRRKGTHFALDPLPERVKRIGLTHYIIHSSLIAHVSLLKNDYDTSAISGEIQRRLVTII